MLERFSSKKFETPRETTARRITEFDHRGVQKVPIPPPSGDKNSQIDLSRQNSSIGGFSRADSAKYLDDDDRTISDLKTDVHHLAKSHHAPSSPSFNPTPSHSQLNVHDRSNSDILVGRSTIHRLIPLLQLLSAFICLMMLSNVQFGWTLFIEPLSKKYNWSYLSIQFIFTVMILFEALSIPIHVYFLENNSPRLIVIINGLLVGTSWIMYAYVRTLAGFYFAAIFAGIGFGGIYISILGNVLKWFPTLRGLALSIAVSGLGLGSAITIIPIKDSIEKKGYEYTFFYLGLVQSIMIVLFALLLRVPDILPLSHPRVFVPDYPARQNRAEYGPGAILRKRLFWVLYACLFLLFSSGLIMTAQFAPMADDHGVAHQNVAFLGQNDTALAFSLQLDRIMITFTQPLFGYISDRAGREPILCSLFLFKSLGLTLLMWYVDSSMDFVYVTGFMLFPWVEVYSLFPCLCTDIFGRKFGTVNYGLLYTAKGFAAFMVPLANVIRQSTGDWRVIYGLCCAFNIIAGGLLVLVVKPMKSVLMNESDRLIEMGIVDSAGEENPDSELR